MLEKVLLPQLSGDLQLVKKAIYGSSPGETGILTEMELQKQSAMDLRKFLEEKVEQFIALAKAAEQKVEDRVTPLETWKKSMDDWKLNLMTRVAIICGFCSGFGALIGILITKSELVAKLLHLN
jgi:hypothetical protein